MSVTTFYYIFYVAALLLIFYIVPKKFQWIVLLLGSIGYYLTADVKYIFFLVAVIIITYLTGRAMEKRNAAQKEELAAEGLDREAKKKIKEKYKKKKRRILGLHIFLTLGILVVVKYTGFVLDNIESLSDAFGWGFVKPEMNFILPLGISFYIFQSIAYVTDLYRDKIKADSNPFRFALFMSFFPQIVQGPIARYSDLAHQLYEEKTFAFKNIKFGAELALYGIFKKLVLADRIGVLVEKVYGNWSDYGTWEIVLATLLYSVQMYADFSGCMDIITGVAQMFDVKLSKNFDHPYFSKTLPEFWRRWHISLGTWFKDYVFYPISVSGFSQNLNKKCRKVFGGEFGRIVSGIIPIYAVWFTTGLWHGASWSYIMWGLFHGTLIALSLIFTPLFDKLSDKLKINRNNFSFNLFRMTRTFLLCSIARVFNRAAGVTDAFRIFRQVLTHNNPWVLWSGSIFSNLGVDTYDLVIIFVSILILWAVGMMQQKFSIREKLEEQNLVFRWLIIYAAIFIILVFGMYGSGFKASDFLYRDF